MMVLLTLRILLRAVRRMILRMTTVRTRVATSTRGLATTAASDLEQLEELIYGKFSNSNELSQGAWRKFLVLRD